LDDKILDWPDTILPIHTLPNIPFLKVNDRSTYKEIMAAIYCGVQDELRSREQETLDLVFALASKWKSTPMQVDFFWV
jgi:hypothetical protein